jgi:hypothetical protein
MKNKGGRGKGFAERPETEMGNSVGRLGRGRSASWRMAGLCLGMRAYKNRKS